MKNSKVLMISSALVMGAIGIILEFFPREVLISIQATGDAPMALFVQITGALYLGSAMTNWMAKAVLIGGIYSRPLAIGNFVHFLVGALALTKFSLSLPPFNAIWVITLVYVLFASLFGFVFFTNPAPRNRTSDSP